MAKGSGFGLVVAAALVVGVAAGTILAIVVAVRRNHADEATTAAATATKVEDPHDKAERLNNLGKDSLQHDNYSEAERYFKEAHETIKYARYSYNVVLAVFMRGRYDEALAWVTTARSEKPDAILASKLDTMVLKINTYSAKSGGAPPTTTGPVNAAVVEPKRAMAEELNERAKSELKTADVQAAMRDFIAAHDVIADPAYAFNVGLACEALELYGESIEWLQRALAEDPDARLKEKIATRIKLVQAEMRKSKK